MSARRDGRRWDLEAGDEPPANVRLDGKDVFYGMSGECTWDGSRRDDKGLARLLFTGVRGDDYYIRYWKPCK